MRPERPDRLVGVGLARLRCGATPAAGYAAAAVRHPDAVALVDEIGTLTFREVHERTNALADGLAGDGVREGDAVAIMCRNHRGFVETLTACSKLGAHAVLLNTAFSAPQLAEVVLRERPRAIVHDDEFAGVLADADPRGTRYVAWREPGMRSGDPLLEDLIARGSRADRRPPSAPGRAIILTSGTTGAPKGASRRQPRC